MILRIGRVALLGSLTCLAGCMVQEPVGPYDGQAPYGTAPYAQPPSGPLVLAPNSLPPGAQYGGSAAPLPPPVAAEPLAAPAGSNGQADSFIPRPAPDDATTGNLEANPPDYSSPDTDAMAPPPNIVTPDDMGGVAPPPPVYGNADATNPPPDVLTPVPAEPSPAAADPSIEQQLAAIKQNLARGATPASTAPPAHYHYGGLSNAGDVAPGNAGGSTSQ